MTIQEMIHQKAEHRYSLKLLSDRSGIPVVTLQKIFAGKTGQPRRSTMAALEKAFQIPEECHETKTQGPAEYAIYHSGDHAAVHSAEKRQSEYTYKDLLTFSGRYGVELIHGFLYEMEIPELKHLDIVSYINGCLLQYMRTEGIHGRIYGSEVLVQLDAEGKTVVRPDLVFLLDECLCQKNQITGAPDLILEIFTGYTRKRDMSVKLQLYMEAGVKEYWMLDPEQKKLVVYPFSKEDFLPAIYPLTGKVPVGILKNGLEIDLEPVTSILAVN